MADGGYQVETVTPEHEDIYPLERRIKHRFRHGQGTYRRTIIVVSDWEEITPETYDGRPNYGTPAR